jgi:hypothetical protein
MKKLILRKSTLLALLLIASFQANSQTQSPTMYKGISSTYGSSGSYFGSYSNATGTHAFGGGYDSDATGAYSIALGVRNRSTNAHTLTLGIDLQATGNRSMVIGSGTATGTDLVNGIPSSLMIGFNSTVPTFFVGGAASANGTGNVGIGTSSPSQKLEVNGNVKLDAIHFDDGTIQTTAFNSSNSILTSLEVTGRLKVGTGSIYIEQLGPGGPNHIYTGATSGALFINSDNGTLTALADNNAHTVLNANNNSAYVAIGTTNPQAKLHVEHSTAKIILNSTGTNGNSDAAIGFKHQGQHKFWMGIDDSHDDIFKIGVNAVNSSTRFSIDNEGDVGIGPNESFAPLHVHATGNSEDIVAIMEDGGRIAFGTSLGANYHNWLTEAGDMGIFWSDKEHTNGDFNQNAGFVIAPKTPSHAGIRIDNKGRLGIGVSEPHYSSKLHVREGMIAIDTENDAIIPELNWHTWQTRISSPVNSAWVATPTDTTQKHMSIGMTSSGFYFGLGEGTIGGPSDIVGLTYPMYVTTDGKLVTREIEVTVNDGWWDKVFDKEYDLLPLDDVAKFIDKNHHLPNVPSEEEVLTDGLNLGDMEGVLLRKVEELTLYILDQEARIKALESEVETSKNN